MRWLGPILLIGVFLRHDTSQWLPGLSPSEWFYVLGGLLEIMLCALILFAFIPRGASLAIAALWIGILEGAQVSTCGLLMWHRRTPPGVNECDFLTSLPIGATMTGLYVIIVCWAIGKAWRRNGIGR